MKNILSALEMATSERALKFYGDIDLDGWRLRRGRRRASGEEAYQQQNAKTIRWQHYLTRVDGIIPSNSAA
jgi:hypothetical protein